MPPLPVSTVALNTFTLKRFVWPVAAFMNSKFLTNSAPRFLSLFPYLNIQIRCPGLRGCSPLLGLILQILFWILRNYSTLRRGLLFPQLLQFVSFAAHFSLCSGVYLFPQKCQGVTVFDDLLSGLGPEFWFLLLSYKALLVRFCTLFCGWSDMVGSCLILNGFPDVLADGFCFCRVMTVT